MRHHWFIGDIHGCFDALRRLEDRIRRASERAGAEPHFVSVGDLVDRGLDSNEVVRWFREGAAAGTHSAILGNHEEMMLRCLWRAVPESFEPHGLSPWVCVGELYREASMRHVWLGEDEFHILNRLMWLSQGGTPTLTSWGLDPLFPESWLLPPEDLAYLCSLPVRFECDAAVATHALMDGPDLERLRLGGPMNEELRDVVSRSLWRRSLPDDGPDRRPHVSGHTPLRRVRRYPDRRLVRVDTGCFMGWRLSAWCPELDRVLSVEGESVLPSH